MRLPQNAGLSEPVHCSCADAPGARRPPDSEDNALRQTPTLPARAAHSLGYRRVAQKGRGIEIKLGRRDQPGIEKMAGEKNGGYLVPTRWPPPALSNQGAGTRPMCACDRKFRASCGWRRGPERNSVFRNVRADPPDANMLSPCYAATGRRHIGMVVPLAASRSPQ